MSQQLARRQCVRVAAGINLLRWVTMTISQGQRVNGNYDFEMTNLDTRLIRYRGVTNHCDELQKPILWFKIGPPLLDDGDRCTNNRIGPT